MKTKNTKRQRYYWKVVREVKCFGDTSYVSANFNLYPKYTIGYDIGITSIPPKGNKLFVFNTLKNAIFFARTNILHYKIMKVKITGTAKKIKRVLYSNRITDCSIFHDYWKTYKVAWFDGYDAPTGTLAVDSVTPIKFVDTPEMIDETV